MPTLDDARIQLEGGLERLDALVEHFDVVAADLAHGQWRSWLDAHRHRWDALIAAERDLGPVLAKARALAERSAPLARWLRQWDEKRAAAFRTAKKLHGVGADAFAPLLTALRAVTPPPPPAAFDNRTRFWFSPNLGTPTNTVVLTTETLKMDGRTVALADVVAISILREGRDAARVTLQLAGGGTHTARIRRDEEEPLARALARVSRAPVTRGP